MLKYYSQPLGKICSLQQKHCVLVDKYGTMKIAATSQSTSISLLSNSLPPSVHDFDEIDITTSCASLFCRKCHVMFNR